MGKRQHLTHPSVTSPAPAQCLVHGGRLLYSSAKGACVSILSLRTDGRIKEVMFVNSSESVKSDTKGFVVFSEVFARSTLGGLCWVSAGRGTGQEWVNKKREGGDDSWPVLILGRAGPGKLPFPWRSLREQEIWGRVCHQSTQMCGGGRQRFG